jgi:cytochrome c peroxidase
LECHHCHTGFNFSDSTRHINTGFVSTPFHNTGLYNLDGQGSYPRGNTGVFELTGKENDMGRFRAPSLRNVALTAPYMHDGSVATLQEVINLYAAGGRNITEGEFAGDGRRNPHKSGFVSGFNISDQSKADLVAFLESLTDERFIQNPRFSDPFSSGKKTTNRANFAGLLESNTPGWLRNIFLSTGILR